MIDNFYWEADDGRIFSSGRQALVAKTDEGYLAFVALHGAACPWPRDNSSGPTAGRPDKQGPFGKQTVAALQDVLTPYGLFIDPAAYAAAKRFALETGGFTYDGHLIATDRDSQSKIGNVALAAGIVGPGFSTDWKCANGSFFTLTQTSAVAMATGVMTFVSSCFSTEGAVVAAIAAGTISGIADVDAAAWPQPHD